MSNHCNYQFITGAKKGTPCNRFIRSKESTLCYQHKAKVVKPKEESIVEPLLEPIKEQSWPASTPMKRKGTAVKINDPEKPKVITTKSDPIDIPVKPIAKEVKPDQSFEQLKIDESSSSDSSSFSVSSSSDSSSSDSSSDSDSD